MLNIVLSAKRLNIVSTTIVDPYVHLLGENSACIAYTRITRFRAAVPRFFNDIFRWGRWKCTT